MALTLQRSSQACQLDLLVHLKPLKRQPPLPSPYLHAQRHKTPFRLLKTEPKWQCFHRTRRFSRKSAPYDHIPLTSDQENGVPFILKHQEECGVSAADCGTGPMAEVVKVLQCEGEEAAAHAANELVGQLNKAGRAALLSALFNFASDNPDTYFDAADVDSDGTLSRQEFSNYVEAQAVLLARSTRPLTGQQLFLLGFRQAIGNVGFGFTDNFIMIVAGDAIQGSIGASLGLSTMMSAGLGNCVADLVGTACREGIEKVAANFMPDPNVSPQQMRYKEVWWVETVGASAGVTVGCILGLLPLFLMGAVRDPNAKVVLANASGPKAQISPAIHQTISTYTVPIRHIGFSKPTEEASIRFVATTSVASEELTGNKPAGFQGTATAFLLLVSAVMLVRRLTKVLRERWKERPESPL